MHVRTLANLPRATSRAGQAWSDPTVVPSAQFRGVGLTLVIDLSPEFQIRSNGPTAATEASSTNAGRRNFHNLTVIGAVSAVCCSAALPPNLQRSIRIISFERPLVNFVVIARQNTHERVRRLM